MPVAIRFFHFLLYLVFRLCEGFVRLLPLDFVFVAGRAGGEIAYRVLPRRRAIALGNLRLAFGKEMSERELRALNREHFQLLGANLLAGLKASVMPDDKIWERVVADVPADRAHIGWVALISHIGNWEILSHLGSRYPEYKFAAVYQRLRNPYIDRHLQETRRRSGTVLFDRRTQLLECVRFLRDGGVVGVLVDQGAGYAGLWTPLFGRLTSSSTLAATLAIRSGLPVVPIAVNTVGGARWKLVISEPVYPDHDDTELLTTQIHRLLEAQIRRSPADWLWAHNRWKPLRPHFLFTRDQRRVFLPPDLNPATLEPFRLLLVSPASVEAAEPTLPAMRLIKKGRPDEWLAILAPAALADFWRRHSEVDHVVAWSAGDFVFAMARAIRAAGKFDAAIFFEPSWRTALAVRLAGIPIRVGRPCGLITYLYNQIPRKPRNPLVPERAHIMIAKNVGAKID